MACVGQTHNSLPRVDDLAGLGQRFHDYAVAISDQLCVAAGVARNIGLRFRRAQLGFGRVRRSLRLVIGRGGNCARSAQIAVAGFVLRRLLRTRSRGAHGFSLCMCGELQIDRVDAHERLPALDGLPRIDKAFQHLAGHTEAEVALHPGSDDPRE